MKLRYSPCTLVGLTTGGISMPVFYDPHTQIFNSRPPGTLITGAPGSGKTFLALTLAAISTIMGKTTIVLDPKGDFLSLLNIKNDIGSFELWNLLDGKNKGILDPFNMTDNTGEKLSLVIDVIELFLGGLTDTQMTALTPIIQDVIEDSNPSLSKVVQMLRSSDREAAQGLGTRLNIISKMSFAKLCFAPGNRSMKKVSLSGGLTVITLLGLNLPTDAEEAKATNEGRLASGILYLLTDFIRRIMRDDTSNKPKTLFIDEAWTVIASRQGANVIKQVSLLGRSKNLALCLITQSPKHLESLDIESTIKTRFAFMSSKDDAKMTVSDMNLPEGEGFEDIIIDLNTGECLMQDWRDRYSTVQITDWKSDWVTAFSSNPLDRKINEKPSQ